MRRARPKSKKAALKKLKQEEKLQGYTTEAKETKSRKGKPAKKGKILIGVLAALIVLIFIVMGFGLFDGNNLLAPVENGKINVLLLGVDEDGLRTDSIMVASYDINEAKVNLLSIPRDTKIYIENRKVTRKINEIHAMSSKQEKGEILGAEAMAEVVTQVTGIPINYYVEFSFSSIDRLFDILGPVEFDVPDVEGNGRGMNYDDPVQNLHIHLKPGPQQLSGNQIQQFLRYRKSNSGVGTGSDTDRVNRQQALFKAVVEQKVNVGILVKVPSIFAQISKEIKTNIDTGDITKYIRYVAKLSGDSVITHTMPGENKTLSGGSYFVVDIEGTKNMVFEVFGYNVTPTDSVTVSDSHSQKILKAGNKQKKTDDKTEETPAPEVTKAPTPSPEAAITEEPTRAPEVTKTPTNTPAPTKKPTATNTPLEEIPDDVGSDTDGGSDSDITTLE